MPARAIWKGVIRCGEIPVPVKLYSAIEDRSVHFRLLHSDDHVPVQQAMVNPRTDEVVPREQVRRGYITEAGDLVMLRREDLAAIEPDASRDIEVLRFVPKSMVDHRWYRRPYYLGPDGPSEPWSALAAALERSGRVGLVHWTMRKQEYAGALRVHQGYPMLMALRRPEEVVSVDELESPHGPELDTRELEMAHRLVEMLEERFDPSQYHDEYRARVLQLIDTKARGGSVRAIRPRRARAPEDLTGALEASLQRGRKSA